MNVRQAAISTSSRCRTGASLVGLMGPGYPGQLLLTQTCAGSRAAGVPPRPGCGNSSCVNNYSVDHNPTGTCVWPPEMPAGDWDVEPTDSRVGFVARHMMVTKARGQFSEYTADVTIGENLLDSKVSVTVQMASVDTGNADRDGHLRTNHFFDIDTYPTMRFESTRIVADGDDYKLIGDLTIKGVTKSVEFDVEFEGLGTDPWGGTRAGFEAKAAI